MYLALDTESMIKYTDTPLCNSRDAEMYDGWFNNGESITVMNEDLSVMPKTYMEVAESDCLRDCGITYAERLQELGIEIELHDIAAAMHGFDAYLRTVVISRRCERAGVGKAGYDYHADESCRGCHRGTESTCSDGVGAKMQ